MMTFDVPTELKTAKAKIDISKLKQILQKT